MILQGKCKMDLILERYKAEYEKVKNIRHWFDSYIDHCFYDGKETEYIKSYLDGSTRFEYYYVFNNVLFKKEFSFKGKVFKIRYYDKTGNLIKAEKTEYYKTEYESLDCLHLPFDSSDLMYLSVGKGFRSKKSFQKEHEKMEKENEEEKRYFEKQEKDQEPYW